MSDRTAWRRSGAMAVSVLVSGALLLVLYRRLEVEKVVEALIAARPLWGAVAVAAILPITLLRAMRFAWVAPAGALPGIGEALRLTLVASAFNVFVPAKAGDLVKSYFVSRDSETPPGVAIAMVVYERVCDLFGLFCWCAIGWAIAGPQVPPLPSRFDVVLAGLGAVCAVLISSERAAAAAAAVAASLARHDKLRRVRTLAEGWPELLRALRGRRARIAALSLLLWFAHLFQIWLFTIALRALVPLAACGSLAALGLLAGQVPLTLAGIGARDVALVALFAPYMGLESAAALGVLVTTRNVVPPLVGLPLMRTYVASMLGESRRSRRQVEHLG